MATHAQDDGFHEIQLNGKQLVFLFMAATVVSVVIFLCGVLVGRGVRAERGGAPDTAAAETSPADLSAAPAAAAVTPAESDPTKAPPPPEAEDLTYFKRLEQKNSPVETLPPRDSASGRQQPSAARDSGASSRESKTAAQREAAPTRGDAASAAKGKSGVAAAAAVPPPGSGFAVQVAALNARGEADAVAKRLADKGYAAYVLAPARGTPAVFRVRVGTFKTRREAEAIAAKLQKEEQFKPWITR